jgi:PAS domain S-box-containing protein
LFPLSGQEEYLATASRMAIFVVIGGVVSLLSSRLSASEQQLHDIIEFLPDATFAIDREGRVIAWNRAIEEMTGRKKAEMLNRGNFEYSLAFYPERRPMLAGLLISNEVITEEKYPSIRREGGNLVSEEHLANFNGGRSAHLRCSGRALVGADGKVSGAIESIRDVTREIMTETALQNTNNRLNTLAGIIRHDLSARLAILYGHLRLGVMKFNDPEVISFIAAIQDSANSMKRQIDISRAFREIGTMPPAWISVQGAVNEAAGRIDPGKVAFRAWTDRLEVFSDPHLPTVFYHIFHNSLKLETGAKKIVVTYQLREDDCAIIIEDDGTGIPDTEKEKLFLQREDSYGRGLFLAHEILSITGMTIRETGTFGKGARFEIMVPSEGYRVEGMES